MKKLSFLLLLCLFCAFMSDNNENKNMETQLEKLQNQLQKWQTDLISYEAWAQQNDGVLDKKEKEEIKKRKEDILDIAKHILKIGKAKNLNFPFADALKTLIIKSAEKKSDNTLEIKEEAPDVKEGEFAKVLVNWAVDLDLKLTDFKKELGDVRISSTGKENISKRFISTIPIIVDIKKVLDAKLPACVTIGEVCDILSSESQSYHSEKNAEKHFAKNKAAYRKDKTKGYYIISPSSEQICAALKAAIDKTDPNHPEVKAAEEAKRKEEEAKRKEEEAKLEALKIKFDDKLLAWSAACNDNIVYKSDSFPLKKISKAMAEKRADQAFSGISITPFSLYLRNETLKRLATDDSNGLNSNDLLNMMDVLKKVIKEAVLKFERKSSNILFEAWMKDFNVFPNSGELLDWAIMSVPVSQLNFEEDMKWWINNAKSAVAEVYKEKSYIRFDKKRLLREMAQCFNYPSTIPAEISDLYILPILSSAKQTTLSVKELDELWVKSLDNLSKSLSVIYKNLLQRGIPMADLPTKFPTAARIAIALDQSEYAVPAPQAPMEEEGKMDLSIELKVSNYPADNFWGIFNRTIGHIANTLGIDTELSASERKLYEAYVKTQGTIVFEIPLDYQNFKVNSKNGAKEVWYPVPKADNITLNFKDSTLTVSNPKIRAINSGLIGETNFNKKYQISFEFSLPQEVIAASVSAASNVLLYEHSSSGETSYSIEAKKNTICIDFELGAAYYGGVLNVAPIDGTVATKIPKGTTAEWFKFKAKALKKIQLRPFPNK